MSSEHLVFPVETRFLVEGNHGYISSYVKGYTSEKVVKIHLHGLIICWQILDGKSLHEIAIIMAQEFDYDFATILKEVENLIANLLKKGLLKHCTSI